MENLHSIKIELIWTRLRSGMSEMYFKRKETQSLVKHKAAYKAGVKQFSGVELYTVLANAA